MKMYLGNWKIFFTAWPAWFRYAIAKKTARAWFLVLVYYPLNVGNNVLTGGDPHTSISLRVWRDRNDNWFAATINQVANFLFHKDGAPDRFTSQYGEGTDNDRELPSPQQGVAITFGILVWVTGLGNLFL